MNMESRISCDGVSHRYHTASCFYYIRLEALHVIRVDLFVCWLVGWLVRSFVTLVVIFQKVKV